MVNPAVEMTRYIAFLRAINVGGRNIKMDQLRALFEALDLANVETFIASGNVVFYAPAQDTDELERRIERHLQASLGYRVDTFLRTTTELAEIEDFDPFPEAEVNAPDNSLYVGFLRVTPDAAAQANVAALRTVMDTFYIHERQLFWLIRGKLSESSVTGALLEKALGSPSTLRNVTTVRRLAAKYPES